MAFPRLSLFCHLSPQTLSSAGSRGEFYMTLKTLCVFCGKHIFNRTCWVPECVLSFHLRSSPTLCSPLSHPPFVSVSLLWRVRGFLFVASPTWQQCSHCWESVCLSVGLNEMCALSQVELGQHAGRTRRWRRKVCGVFIWEIENRNRTLTPFNSFFLYWCFVFFQCSSL